ncbi:hypothetical protein R1flu_014952 [Riccia fluitans]|uniref:Oxysterol-binding protein n=1 Tax=Riccia fluitans TaxID=41844 RepID=A0ABD1YHK1_9MARC
MHAMSCHPVASISHIFSSPSGKLLLTSSSTAHTQALFLQLPHFHLDGGVRSKETDHRRMVLILELGAVSASLDVKHKNVVFRILDVLKGMRPGSDLTSFQVPPQFNLPKSQLQCYSEMVYCCGQNLLEQCADGATPAERFLAVVRWFISTVRPVPFGKAPYNPILGETHHVTAGDLNLLIEQVSHHPPISALHATNTKRKIQLSNWNKPVPKFHGHSVEVIVEGKNYLTLGEHDETYVTTSPKLNFKFFPNHGSEWTGETTVTCEKSGLEASVIFKAKSFLGLRGGSNRVAGKIRSTDSSKVLYNLHGSWDDIVMLEDTDMGKKTVLYDGKAAIGGLKPPVIKNLQAVSPMDSVVVWSKVTEGVWNHNWDLAREEKHRVEDNQRQLRKQRAKAGQTWTPKYFSQTSQGGWLWRFEDQPVPDAPIVLD